MTQRQPTLFLGHGSPMTMITANPEREALAALGSRLLERNPPRAILCISAHWETGGKTHLSSGAAPRTIHDFRGFPEELYQLTYPAPGADELVERVRALLGAEGTAPDATWGFDHGTFGVLLPMFPRADIPTVAMSLNRALTPEQHLALGKALVPLRDEGVLIVGSGNVVHNLALYRRGRGTVPGWARDFQDRINQALIAADTAALTRFAPDDEAALAAINSAEHYLPLLYPTGARLPGDGVAIFNDSLDGSLSMTSALIGDVDLVREMV